jgi:hypothetical protein
MPILLHLGSGGLDDLIMAAVTIVAVVITTLVTWNRTR